MIIFKGDKIKLKTGEVCTVVDTWGIARFWCKVQMDDGRIKFAMVDKIESVIKSDFKRKGKTRWKP